MSRPVSPLYLNSFDGEFDDVPMVIGQRQASTLENFYKVRNKLVRRAGQSALGSASLSPDEDLR